MSRDSRAPVLLWARNTDVQGIRLSSVVLGMAYPVLHFFTLLEDPAQQEPLWQYQLAGAVFLAIAVASLMGWGRRWLHTLFYSALFGTAAWGLWSMYERGYHGTRVSLSTVLVASALLILSSRLLVLYILFLMSGVAFGMTLAGKPLSFLVTVTGRLVVGLVLVGVLGGVRLWARRREARHERSLRSLVEGSPVPTLLVAHDICQLANHAAARSLSISAGDSLRDLFVGDPPWWLSRGRRGSGQVQLRARSGAEMWCEVSFAPVEEEPHLLQVTLVDKTSDRDRMRIKDELLGSISRELRPPLMAIKRAFVSKESTVVAAGELGSVAEDAMRGLQHMERLLEDMLLVHSLTGDASRDELRNHSAAEVCAQARALVLLHAQARGVTVSVGDPVESVLAVRTDMQAAGHALAILLTMAVDATMPGGQVTVRVEARDPWVYYRVEGAPLWNESGAPFRADAAALPLTIARSLAARVGGLLDAEPHAQLGIGMALSIRLLAADDGQALRPAH